MTIILIIGVVIFMIWLVNKRNQIDREEEVRQISGELRVKYPNFVKAIREVYQSKAKLYADNNKALCYQVPVETFNRHMGDFYYSIIDTTNVGNKPYIIQVFKGNNRVEINTERYFLHNDIDLTIEQYIENFNDLAKEVMSDSRYLNSITY